MFKVIQGGKGREVEFDRENNQASNNLNLNINKYIEKLRSASNCPVCMGKGEVIITTGALVRWMTCQLCEGRGKR